MDIEASLAVTDYNNVAARANITNQTITYYMTLISILYMLPILGDEDASSQKVNPDIWKSSPHV